MYVTVQTCAMMLNEKIQRRTLRAWHDDCTRICTYRYTRGRHTAIRIIIFFDYSQPYSVHMLHKTYATHHHRLVGVYYDTMNSFANDIARYARQKTTLNRVLLLRRLSAETDGFSFARRRVPTAAA